MLPELLQSAWCRWSLGTSVFNDWLIKCHSFRPLQEDLRWPVIQESRPQAKQGKVFPNAVQIVKIPGKDFGYYKLHSLSHRGNSSVYNPCQKES